MCVCVCVFLYICVLGAISIQFYDDDDYYYYYYYYYYYFIHLLFFTLLFFYFCIARFRGCSQSQEFNANVSMSVSEMFARALPGKPAYPVLGNHNGFPVNQVRKHRG